MGKKIPYVRYRMGPQDKLPKKVAELYGSWYIYIYTPIVDGDYVYIGAGVSSNGGP